MSAATGAGLFSLSGKRVMITGASRGIGRGLALGLAEAGADLVLVARDVSALSTVREECLALRSDASVSVLSCDIREPEQVKETVKSAVAEGNIDVLVNNAGLNIRTPALEVTEEQWQTVIDTDLRGAFFFAQQVGQHMVDRQQGSIINVSSVGGHVALRTGVAYAAAKAGVIQMTKVLALEWGKSKVRVNCIAPWYFRTPLTEKLLDDPAYLGEIVARTPLRRVGEVSELVGPAVFLASDASSYVTGHTLFVDGGMSIYGF
ncbi:SDR family NAD(P)-dependent oxidoreductase [Alicyclobacillus ferrooxydans]|uniref:L-rhamnose 1-dehydrogenase (NAD(P)(+)) n=1 Tax=Alicyclobacillus ferrooxydans TaxID=471514 RepID=A0A0P9CRL0_9BACL|nr:glucose 1-dehydrogenase [Alicyclobacillus ferrooxydans]KPV42108.1 2-deoxy-D-gluconate 3-dehydrogenase [Alicyclobacillus ferrooxydans]